MGKTTKPAKQTKKRAAKYEKKLKINGTFEDVIRISVGKEPRKKPKTR